MITLTPLFLPQGTLSFAGCVRSFVLGVIATIPIASAVEVDPVVELEHLERLAQDVIDDKSAVKAFDELISKLQSADALSRGNAAAIIGRLPFLVNKTILAKIDTKRAGQLLAKLVDDPNQGTQVAALGALEAYPIAASENLDRLSALLLRDDDRVAYVAASTLGSLGSLAASATPKLAKCFEESKDEIVQQACADALGYIGPAAKESIGTLSRYVQNNRGDLRIYAARALGKIDVNDKRAADALLNEAETTDDDNHRELSFGFLADLAKVSHYSSDVLRGAASSRNAKVRKNAQKSLKRLADSKADK